jgi:hypothetical protein
MAERGHNACAYRFLANAQVNESGDGTFSE